MPVPFKLNPKRSWLERWARFTHRRRGTVIVSWIVFLVALVFALTRFGGEFSTEFSLPGSEVPAGARPSRRALSLPRRWRCRHRFRSTGRHRNVPSCHRSRPRRTFRPPQRCRNRISLREPRLHLGRWHHRPRRPALRFSPRDIPRSTAEGVMAIADANSTRDLTVVAGGNVIEFNEQPDFGSELSASSSPSSSCSSPLAPSSPWASRLAPRSSALAPGSPSGILAHLFGFPDFSTQFAAMIGIGVGIDYSLLVVTRFREGLHAGHNVEDSVVIAVTTAGRSVIFAGIVVALAFLGLFVMGLPFVAMLGTCGRDRGHARRARRAHHHAGRAVARRSSHR